MYSGRQVQILYWNLLSVCMVEVDAADSSKTLVSVCQTTRCLMPIITTKGTAYQETPDAVNDPCL